MLYFVAYVAGVLTVPALGFCLLLYAEHLDRQYEDPYN